MVGSFSRSAAALSLMAAASMVATPALARESYYPVVMKSAAAHDVTGGIAWSKDSDVARDHGWNGSWGGRRHRDGVSAGDIFAGVLILGGIAAVASAASKNNQQRRAQEIPRDYRYPDRAEDSAGYRRDDYRRDDNRSNWGETGGINSAVDNCVSAVERGRNRVSSVDTVNRDGDGWRVSGEVDGGRDFACSIERSGEVRSVTVNGRSAFSDDDGDLVPEAEVEAEVVL